MSRYLKMSRNACCGNAQWSSLRPTSCDMREGHLAGDEAGNGGRNLVSLPLGLGEHDGLASAGVHSQQLGQDAASGVLLYLDCQRPVPPQAPRYLPSGAHPTRKNGGAPATAADVGCGEGKRTNRETRQQFIKTLFPPIFCQLDASVNYTVRRALSAGQPIAEMCRTAIPSLPMGRRPSCLT